jgi:hypothetical protein
LITFPSITSIPHLQEASHVADHHTSYLQPPLFALDPKNETSTSYIKTKT